MSLQKLELGDAGIQDEQGAIIDATPGCIKIHPCALQEACFNMVDVARCMSS
jgi:hypothetical protein